MSLTPRRLRPRIAALLAGVLASTRIAAAPLDEPRPLEEVRDCAAKAAPAISGIDELGAVCPQLAEALKSLGFDAMLHEDSGRQLNRDALRDLVSLAERYSGSKPQTSADIAALPGILKSVARERAPLIQSWWQALGAWLRSWFTQNSDTLNWLDRWLERIGKSTTLFNVISYSLVAIVLIAAVTVIINELKAAGQVRLRRNRRGGAAAGSAPGEIAPLAAGAESMALADRLAALLRMLVQRLTQIGRLKAERSLTHRELVARSAFDLESQRAVFASVASAAESMLYGPKGAPPERLERVLREGQTLLAQLSGSSSAR